MTIKLQKGFSNITIILVIIIVVAVGGYFALRDSGTVVAPTESPAPSETSASSTKPGDGVVCTMDAKQCPDGSYVGRVGPKCEFKPCPVIKLASYTNTKYNFSLQYPATWQFSGQNQENIVFFKTAGDLKNEIYVGMENNPKQLTAMAWLEAISINTEKAETIQINGQTAIRLVDNASVPTVNIYIALGDKVVHFFVEQQTDYMAIFDQLVSSFKLFNQAL